MSTKDDRQEQITIKISLTAHSLVMLSLTSVDACLQPGCQCGVRLPVL